MALKGIDVSRYQAGLDLKGTGAQFAIIKATGGDDGLYVDAECDRHYRLAKKQGLKRGVYHFAGGGNATTEADYFVNNCKGYIKDALLVLDFEGTAINKGVSWAKTFLDRVYARTGVKPLIYMSASVISRYDWSPVVKSDYGLWVAGYPDRRSSWAVPAFPYNIKPWPFYALWQYTDSNGTLDRDIFNGTAAAWDAYAGVPKSVTKPPVKETTNAPTQPPKTTPAQPSQPTAPAPQAPVAAPTPVQPVPVQPPVETQPAPTAPETAPAPSKISTNSSPEAKTTPAQEFFAQLWQLLVAIIKRLFGAK